MTQDELDELLEEIRASGMQEGTAVEWKRVWYDLKIQAQQEEFVRDIAAMANAHTTDPRVVIFGLRGDGTTHQAPLPEDEARLQDRLKKITPTPNVRFSNVTLRDGTQLSLAEVLPPFDPPHVAIQGDRNYIFVRQGSKTNTATRNQLDRWYQQRQPKPTLALRLDREDIQTGEKRSVKREFLQLRKRRAAPGETPHPEQTLVGVIERGLPFTSLLGGETDERKSRQAKLDRMNHVMWIDLEVSNTGSVAAENLDATLEISGIRGIELYETEIEQVFDSSRIPLVQPEWATNPAENCFVERYAVDRSGVGEVLQRLKRVNPGMRERFISLALILPKTTWPTRAKTVGVRYTVVDRSGARTEGSLSLEVEFTGLRELSETEAAALEVD